MTDPDLEVTRIRRFGTIVARKRSDGSISAWLARYSSPVDGRRVQRSFESVRDAESWLAGEHELVEMHRRGLKQWVHPTDRDRRKKAGSMTFDELADWYVDTHRKPDGTALRGAARRNLRTDVGHLKDVFGGMTVKQITPDVISKWYFGEHEEGEWVFPRMCQRLKAIMDVSPTIWETSAWRTGGTIHTSRPTGPFNADVCLNSTASPHGARISPKPSSKPSPVFPLDQSRWPGSRISTEPKWFS